MSLHNTSALRPIVAIKQEEQKEHDDHEHAAPPNTRWTKMACCEENIDVPIVCCSNGVNCISTPHDSYYATGKMAGGWNHMWKCTNLRELPERHQDWYCDKCVRCFNKEQDPNLKLVRITAGSVR